MADIVVKVVMENVARLLGQEYEKSLGRGVEREVETLQKELETINSFLKNSEAKRIENDEVQKVVDQIRDEVQHAEDVVDTYMANVIEQNRRNPVLRKLCRLFFGHGRKLRDAGNKIKSIRNTINLIYNNKYRYGILQVDDMEDSSSYHDEKASLKHKESSNLPQQEEDEADDWWRKNVEECVAESSDVRDKESLKHKAESSPQQEQEDNNTSLRWQRGNDIDVVGFENETTTLVRQLIDGDPRLDVVSITGTGGSGKTTLASKIYNHNHVMNHFHCHAWVFASQKYIIKDLLFRILRCLVSSSIPEEMCKMSDEELKLTLRAFLREKRYLVVIDDVRTSYLWDEVREAFPNSFNGSRLLITCNKEVTLFASQTLPYSLSPLDHDTSWKLFCKKAFTYECPPDLEAPAKKLVESCKGVPLSIVVLAGFLANNKDRTYETWSKLVEFVNFNYSQNTRSSDILSLSYNHLPRNLKSCFLYLAAFPIDFVISAKHLIKLWSAEGFIQTPKSENGEDVAEDYLKELSNRSLIRVSNRRSDGGAKTCHIHEVLRELSVSESVREKLIEVHLEANNPASITKARRSSIFTRLLHLLLWRNFVEVHSESISKARRLSIQGNITQYISSHPHVPSRARARSLLLFGEGNEFSIKHWRWIYNNFKFLRVLCLEKVHLRSIPKHIEKLVFLRYLRIWSEKVFRINSIPASICNLQYLETIDISGRVQESLPKGIWMMKQLRHLNFSGGMNFPETIIDTSSSKLQVLSCLIVDGKSAHFILRFGFPNLRKLNLKYDESNQMNEFEVADVLESLSFLTQLENLKILDFPTSEPRSNLFPSTLVKISFLRSYFNSTQFGILAKLPNLEILKLKGKFPYYGILGPLACVAGDFPKLQVFQMIDLEIGIWVLESGAMKMLERLVIRECYQLRNVPKELTNLSALRLVEVSQMTKGFTEMLKELDFGVKCELLIDSVPL